jgi:hypothetical protein
MTDTLPPDLKAKLNALLDEAYGFGFRAGAAYTRNAILNAAQIPENLAAPAQVNRANGAAHKEVKPRAIRGSVSLLVSKILKDMPGSTMKQIEEYAPTVDASISPRSVSGEVRRFKGTRYIQRDQRWYLKGTEPDVGGVTGVAAPAVN